MESLWSFLHLNRPHPEFLRYKIPQYMFPNDQVKRGFTGKRSKKAQKMPPLRDAYSATKILSFDPADFQSRTVYIFTVVKESTENIISCYSPSFLFQLRAGDAGNHCMCIICLHLRSRKECRAKIIWSLSDFDNVVQSSSKNKDRILVSIKNGLCHHCCFSLVALCLVWWFLFFRTS